MKKTMVVLALLACGMTLAAEQPAWRFAFQPFSGRYSIYGGGLADPTEPSKDSRNIAFSVNGQVAKQMFDAMGPDLKDTCGTEDGTRMRQRAELACSYSPQAGYQCTFGFDLANGRSIGGSVC